MKNQISFVLTGNADNFNKTISVSSKKLSEAREAFAYVAASAINAKDNITVFSENQKRNYLFF